MYVYSNGKRIPIKLFDTVCDEVLKTIKKELPKEYQCQVIIEDILSKTQEKLKAVPLEL